MVKKIHYVWLGGKPLPANVRSCLRSWRKFCPDWEIVRWDENSFHVDEFRWTREALTAGKFAFAADFIRLYALNAVGGYILTRMSRSSVR